MLSQRLMAALSGATSSIFSKNFGGKIWGKASIFFMRSFCSFRGPPRRRHGFPALRARDLHALADDLREPRDVVPRELGIGERDVHVGSAMRARLQAQRQEPARTQRPQARLLRDPCP